jgi:hypothetical protein
VAVVLVGIAASVVFGGRGDATTERGIELAPQPGMGDPLLGLTADQMDRFDAGRIDYGAPLSGDGGLGPIFNKESCGNCHNNPLGGAGTQTVTRFGLSDKGEFDPLERFGGSLLQALTIMEGCEEVIAPEANVIASRLTLGTLGYGLVEAIPDADLLALEQDPPGVSGRAHMVEALEDPGVLRVGRFGWKAQVPTVLTFSGDAARNEMGLTNRLVPTENDPNGIRAPHLEDCDTVDDPEDGPDREGRHFIDRVTDFQRYLAAPPQTPRSGMTGEGIFVSIGCAQCHATDFVTANDDTIEDALRAKAIRPYSDFLLHDMGLAGDAIAQGDAGEQEIRTTPLWGLRHRDPMWHDGRFGGGPFEERVTLAIEEHDAALSEAREAGIIDNWRALSSTDRDLVLRFFDSLGRIEFDADGDDDVERDDFVAFADCFFGAGPYDADHPCAVSDVDQDTDVDAGDYAVFLLAYTGPREDCNDNGELDLTDIIEGTSLDVNRNGIPDECEPCLADVDGSGAVDTGDLVAVLAAWGPCPGCPEDFDGSGVVDTGDLLVVLSTWGPCK